MEEVASFPWLCFEIQTICTRFSSLPSELPYDGQCQISSIHDLLPRSAASFDLWRHRLMSWVGSPTFPFMMLQNQCHVGDCFWDCRAPDCKWGSQLPNSICLPKRSLSSVKPGKRVQNSTSNGQMYLYTSSKYTTKRRASASLVHLKRGDSTNSQKRLQFPQAFQNSSSATSWPFWDQVFCLRLEP